MLIYKCDLCGSLIEGSIEDRKYKIVCTEKNNMKGSPYTMDICDACYDSIKGFIDKEPKLYSTTSCYVSPVKYGNWERTYSGTPYCSACGDYPTDNEYPFTNYCPNCGAKMDERREDGEIHRRGFADQGSQRVHEVLSSGPAARRHVH